MFHRPGIPSDASAIAELIANFQMQLTDEVDGSGAEQYLASVSKDAEEGYIASERFDYVLACNDDKLIGFIAMRDVTHIFHLFVKLSHQGKGVASGLWCEARTRAERKLPTPTFTVNSSLLAVPVYQAWGFRATGPITRAHGISFLPMRRPHGA